MKNLFHLPLELLKYKRNTKGVSPNLHNYHSTQYQETGKGEKNLSKETLTQKLFRENE